MKIGKFEVGADKLLTVASALLGVATLVVNNAVQANEKKAYKAEIKEEVMKELLKEQN